MVSSNMKENNEQFSGNELDELGNGDIKSILEKEISKNNKRKYRGKRRLSLLIAIGMSLLTGIGYLYLQKEKIPIESHQKKINQEKESSRVQGFKVENDILLTFNSFVIPFKENKEFSCLSLSISFNLPNKELKREMIEKKYQLRGIIYDTLREEINKRKDVPPLERAKYLIIREIDKALSAGKVNEIYINQFFAV